MNRPRPQSLYQPSPGEAPKPAHSLAGSETGGAKDGVIKYTAEHVFAPLPDSPDFLATLKALDAARTVLHQAGLVGVDAQGTGYGNLSARLPALAPDTAGPPLFLISGSGTGKAPVLGAEGYCRVLACHAEANRVDSVGPVRASSESMSHDAVYRANPSVRFVIHVHHRAFFDALLKEGWPHTPASVAYGTPEMAQAVTALVRSMPGDEGLFVSAGHVEGLFAYGVDLDRLISGLMDLFRRYTVKESHNIA